MHSDPQDEQWTLPESRDGEPRDPVGDGGRLTPEEPSEAPPPPKMPPLGATPPQMPAPPQMPVGGPPPSAWGSTPPPPPRSAAKTPVGSPPPDAQVAPGSPAPGDAAPESADAPDAAPVIEQARAVAPEQDAAPAKGVVRPGPKAGLGPVIQGDWLASVCPYLTSEDGAYRSAAPDEGHRCTAQDPAATLPLAFQERYCLTDRHPRCEMYKFAQETDAAGGIPADRVPPTDPPTPRTRPSGGGPSRPLLATLAGIAGVIVVVLLVLVFMGSCSGDEDAPAGPDGPPDEQATEAPASTPRPTPTPTSQAEETPAAGAEATPDAAAGEAVRILYEIQPGEALLRVSETFGISRNRIRRENPELAELGPADLPGTIIELPIAGEMTLAEAQALAGYQGLVSEIEAEAGG